ncbi:unnamed protein product [Nippostrongylus brasiliensis]|uniref:ShKT domain-containing protein n=1 Tax=Nippostrongylus brasiliensis TaxID=27835 RepID=A0A0N4YQA1_NIPBR|nr:unnamed protein product [Nippostrongylus brasiliensis]
MKIQTDSERDYRRTVIRPEALQSQFRRPQNTFNTLNPTRSFTNRGQSVSRRPSPASSFCFDRDGAERCADWVPYCRSERFYTYMRMYCTRSCGFC